MALIKIRGGQIQAGALTDLHVADNAAIAETKLNINWAGRQDEALQRKKLLDTVQLTVAGVTGTEVPVVLGITKAEVAATDLGVICEDFDGKGKNKVIVRAAGEPVIEPVSDTEVYGRMTWDATANEGAGGFALKFFAGAEAPYTFGEATDIEIAYIARFNLLTVDETFAMNTRFVDGAADVTSTLNLQQLALDLYGADELTRTGDAFLAKSLTTQISEETTARENADTAINEAISAEQTARAEADTAIRNDFASNVTGKGAALVGVEDATSIFTATTVEGVLVEIDGAYKAADTQIKNDLASVAAGKGAGTVGVEDAAGKFTGATVEAVLAEIDTAYKAADTAHAEDLASLVAGKGASLIGVEDAAENFVGTTVETVLAELKEAIEGGGGAFDQFKLDLASQEAGKGASLIGIQDVGNLITATTVEGALAEIAANIDTLEGNVASHIQDFNDFQTTLAAPGGAALVGVIDADGHFVSSDVEGILAELGAEDNALAGRIEAIETAPTLTPVKKVVTVDGTMIVSGEVVIPDADTFENAAELDVFVNGILQIETVHYTVDDINKNKVTFGADSLVVGDYVIFKYFKRV